VFVPSNNAIYHSIDVYFDEHFESTIAFESNRYPGYVDCVITDAKAHEDLDVQRTGSALWFSNKKRLLSGAVVQTFAHPHVKEEYDIDLHNDNTSSQDAPLPMFDQLQNTTSDNPICIDNTSLHSPAQSPAQSLGEEEDSDSITTSHTTASTETPTESSPIADDDVRSTLAVAPIKPPRYLTRHQAKIQHATNTHQPSVVWPPPEEYITHVEQAFQAEVTTPIQAIRTMDPLMFLPVPESWRQILKLPPTIQTHWANALLVEIKELIKKKTFAHANPNKDDPIIPVTSKYRVKLSPE
jgi:hypothetical protein